MNSSAANKTENLACANYSADLQTYIKTLQFFDSALDSYLYIYDLKNERVYFTDKIREKFPLMPSSNGNDINEWMAIVYHRDREFMEYSRKHLLEGKINVIDMAYRILDREGNKVWMSVKGSVCQEGDSQLLVGRIAPMTQGHMVDSLTGLCYTEKFAEDLKQYQSLSDGYLMLLGVDNFKKINITQGRAAGDDVLKKVTSAMDRYTQYPLSLYRVDGDHFAVIFPSKHKKDVIEFYNSVKYEMTNVCTLSAGAVRYKNDKKQENSAIYQYAESALDRAKKEGKNRLIFFSPDVYQKDMETIEMLNEITEAVQQGCSGFHLCFQPQISSDFEIYGIEALLRYTSPTRGPVGPQELIPLLEESRLICNVGEWVLKTALAQCREWRKQIPDLRVSVNVSHVQLQQKSFTDTVLDLLREAGLPGDALVLEITESIQLQDYASLNKIFYIWKQYGIKISIDDFGTGYSSLSYLKSIEADEIKIDRCFVNAINHNTYNFQLLRNMIELAASAHIQVCCEGVETAEELAALQKLQPNLYQGYLFARPCTKEEFEQAYICSDSPAYRQRKEKEAGLHPLKRGGKTAAFEQMLKEELGNITDSMDEVVYVSDPNTYELYYLNAAGRKLTGMHDYYGCKCHQVLHGRSTPCEICNNKLLTQDEFYIREKENTFLKRKYLIKDKLIPWQGKQMRLEIAIDITQKEIVSESVRKRMDLGQSIVKTCKMVAAEQDPEKNAENLTRAVGEYCRGRRAYLLTVDEDTGIYDLKSEWYAEGEASIKRYFPIVLSNIREETSRQRISAWIFQNGKKVALLGVDDPHYWEDGCDLVQTMAYFMSCTLFSKENN